MQSYNAPGGACLHLQVGLLLAWVQRVQLQAHCRLVRLRVLIPTAKGGGGEGDSTRDQSSPPKTETVENALSTGAMENACTYRHKSPLCSTWADSQRRGLRVARCIKVLYAAPLHCDTESNNKNWNKFHDGQSRSTPAGFKATLHYLGNESLN